MWVSLNLELPRRGDQVLVFVSSGIGENSVYRGRVELVTFDYVRSDSGQSVEDPTFSSDQGEVSFQWRKSDNFCQREVCCEGDPQEDQQIVCWMPIPPAPVNYTHVFALADVMEEATRKGKA